MPFVRVDDVVLHYRIVGSGPRVVFLNSLGSDMRIWDEVVSRLQDRYEILLYDKRGHGLSDETPSPYSIARHADDILGLMDAIGWSRASLVGLSVGGMIAQEIAARAPDRVEALVLCDTGMKIGTAELWSERVETVEKSGVSALAEGIVGRWFSAAFKNDRPDELKGWRNMVERTTDAGYAGTCVAIRDCDLTEATRTITAPTLCIVGDQDLATTPELMRETAALISGARLEIVTGGHLPCIESPERVTALIADHLEEHAS